VRRSMIILILALTVACAGVVAVFSGSDRPRHRTPAAVAPPGECFYVTYPDGAVSPDPRCSPGQINPAAAAHPRSTICDPAWLARLPKPAARVIAGLAVRYGATAFAYVPAYVIPPQDGGSPTSPANQWPEPLNGWGGFHTRDPVTDELNDRICSGTETVAAAARLLEGDWLSQGIPDDD